VKFGSLVVTCEGCGCQEIIQGSQTKRAFMRSFNRFVRGHRMHEYRAKVGEYKRPKVSKGEQLKRTLRRVSTYGMTKQ
jgi:hypothetical protein